MGAGAEIEVEQLRQRRRGAEMQRLQSSLVDRVNLVETNLLLQESSNRDFVGGVEHGGGAPEGRERIPRQLQTGKACPVRAGIKGFKTQLQTLSVVTMSKRLEM